MKKTGNFVIRMFKAIGLFFDKWLITPLTKLIIRLIKIIKDLTQRFDKVSGKKSTLLIENLM